MSQTLGNNSIRAHTHAIGWTVGPTVTSTAGLATAANKVPTADRPSDEGSTSFVYSVTEDEPIHVQLTVESRGNDTATVPAVVWGVVSDGSGKYEYYELWRGSFTLGGNTDGTWRAPESVTTSNDRSYNSSASQVGGGTDGRAAVQFDASGFPLLQIEINGASAGTADSRAKIRPI